MGKPKATAFLRFREFSNLPNSGLKVKETQLWCTHCNIVLHFERKSVIQKHLNSVGHAQKQGLANQMTIVQVVEKAKRNTDVWQQMVGAFAAAGVPLHVFRHPEMRQWITEHVKNGESLPCETTLRKLLSLEGLSDLEETKTICKGQDVIVISDETTDLKNRKVLNVLIGPAQPGASVRLVTTQFMERCDSSSVSNAVLASLASVGIQNHQFVCLKSDNAKYMLKAGKVLKIICPRMMHSTCWSHILHLVAEDVRGKLKVADVYIANMKAVLTKTPSRRQELQDEYEQFGLPRKLAPVPVITRWGTWLEAGRFHYEHLAAELEWINKTEANSVAVKKLKTIVKKEKLRRQLQQIFNVTPGLCSTIKFLESPSTPSTDVYLLLKTVLGLTYEVFGEESEKLLEYLNSKHPSAQFWKEIQYLDPRKAGQFVKEGVREALPTSLKRFESSVTGIVSQSELLKYEEIRKTTEFDASFSVLKFWNTFSREMPCFQAVALKALSIPASSADVERSFSTLRRVLTPLRSSLSEDNLGTHLRIAYNKKRSCDVEHLERENENEDMSD